MKSGTSMGGSIVNAKKVNRISCDCNTCFHCDKIIIDKRVKNKYGIDNYFRCNYYDIKNPKKNTCARYHRVKQINTKIMKMNKNKLIFKSIV